MPLELLLVFRLFGGFFRPFLSCRGDRSSDRSGNSVDVDLDGVNFGRDSCLLLHRAVARDMTGLAAAVASLTSGAERASVRGGAILADMSKLATSIALHSLRLAVPGKVVGTTALVAGSGTRTAGETATAVPAKSTSTDRAATTESDPAGVGAVTLWHVSNISIELVVTNRTYSQVAFLVAVVATAGAGATQTKRRAVSLHVTQALTVIALLCLSSPRKRALIRLVAWLLACMSSSVNADG